MGYSVPPHNTVFMTDGLKPIKHLKVLVNDAAVSGFPLCALDIIALLIGVLIGADCTFTHPRPVRKMPSRSWSTSANPRKSRRP